MGKHGKILETSVRARLAAQKAEARERRRWLQREAARLREPLSRTESTIYRQEEEESPEA